jgi:hypothetical protein
MYVTALLLDVLVGDNNEETGLSWDDLFRRQ